MRGKSVTMAQTTSIGADTSLTTETVELICPFWHDSHSSFPAVAAVHGPPPSDYIFHMAKDITTLADIIRTHGVSRASANSLIEGDRTRTWGELYERSVRVANALQAAGVGVQDRVAFLDKNSIEHFEVFYGCALINAVSVDINWRLAPPEVEFIVNDSAAKVLVVHADFWPVVEAIRANLTATKLIVVIGGTGGDIDYESWVNSGTTADPGVESASEDVAFQLYSSGTTGRPKGVMLTNNNFFVMLPGARTFWKLSDDMVNLVAMPLFHIGGGGWATAGQFVGSSSIIVREMDPNAVIQLIEKHKITHGFLVPAVLQFMLMMPSVKEADFSSLQLMVYGASPISLEVLTNSVEAFKCDFMQVYGLTETTGATTLLPSEDHDPKGPNAHRLRSCGLPAPGVEIRIMDNDTGKELPAREVGEIWCKSPQVMKGYWNNPKATAESITPDGWFKTGDAGYRDEDGYIYIHDRVKDMIVSGGENVYPAEVESALMSHPAIADVAVIGVPHEKWGETVKAIVVKKADIAVTEAEIIEFSKGLLARFKCPTSVDWIDALPRNPSGKILKKDLRAPYWEGRERMVN
jgi:long-chain acyl-CoA synthetase